MDIDTPDSNLSQPLVPPPPFAEFHFSLPSPMRELANHPFSDFGMSPGSHSGLDSLSFHNQGIGNAWDNTLRVSGGELSVPRADSSVAPALLSLAEQNDLLGFLDRFDWEFEPALPQDLPSFPSKVPVSVMEPSNQLGLRTATSPPTMLTSDHRSEPDDIASSPRRRSRNNPLTASRNIKRRQTSSSTESASPSQNDMNDMTPEKQTKKSLLSQPQKRLNHIMSEQRRRTAIKEGFVTIEKLIAVDPRFEGPLPTLSSSLDRDGSKRSSKGRSVRGKGKMGSLFRAAEFIGFLEENVQALRLEVERLEAAGRQ